MMSGDGLRTLDTEWWWNYVERIMSLIIIMGVKIRDINAATLYLSHASNNDANNWAIIHIMEAHRVTTTYFAGYIKLSTAHEQWISHAANGQLTSLVVYTISVSMFCSETVTDFVVWDREEKSDEHQRYPQLKCIQVMWYQRISVFKPGVQSYTVIKKITDSNSVNKGQGVIYSVGVLTQEWCVYGTTYSSDHTTIQWGRTLIFM